MFEHGFISVATLFHSFTLITVMWNRLNDVLSLINQVFICLNFNVPLNLHPRSLSKTRFGSCTLYNCLESYGVREF